MIEPCRSVAEARYRMVVEILAAQSGKTDGALDIIGARLDQRPVPILYVGPTKQFLTEQFEPRVMQLLDEAPTLAAKVLRGKRMTKTRKVIAGVPLRLAHAGSPTALKAEPMGLLIVDEYVDMKRNLKSAGDPLALAQFRGETYADFVTLVISTPSVGVCESKFDEDSGLEFFVGDPEDIECPQWRLFMQGTRRHFTWLCRGCGEAFIPRFKLLRWAKGASPAEAGRTAWVECPHCQHRHHEKDKAALNAPTLFVAPGQWVEDGEVCGEPPDTDSDSYWTSGLCSPFVTFGQRAESFLTATRSGMEKIQAVTNQGFAELWAPRGGETPELTEVMALKQPYKMGEIPAGVCVITAGVDVQKNRLVVVVRGWGARGESWLIWQGEFFGRTSEGELSDTGQPEVWNDLAQFLETPIGGRRIRLTIIDSGFRPNKKDHGAESIVYDFCRRHQRIARPGKGSATLVRPVILSKIEIQPSGKLASYGLELVRINTDFCKLWVHERIRWPADHRPKSQGIRS